MCVGGLDARKLACGENKKRKKKENMPLSKQYDAAERDDAEAKRLGHQHDALDVANVPC
jgi:hypothetical protein